MNKQFNSNIQALKDNLDWGAEFFYRSGPNGRFLSSGRSVSDFLDLLYDGKEEYATMLDVELDWNIDRIDFSSKKSIKKLDLYDPSVRELVALAYDAMKKGASEVFFMYDPTYEEKLFLYTEEVFWQAAREEFLDLYKEYKCRRVDIKQAFDKYPKLGMLNDVEGIDENN